MASDAEQEGDPYQDGVDLLWHTHDVLHIQCQPALKMLVQEGNNPDVPHVHVVLRPPGVVQRKAV